MSGVFGLPQALTGDEIVTIQQQQNGQLAKCSMPLSDLRSFLLLNWFEDLPTSEPSTAGMPWNNKGVVSIS